MKNLIALVCFCALMPMASAGDLFFGQQVASTSGLTSGNILNESFETATTGYQNTWTTEGGTPNPVSTIPGGGLSAFGTQCMLSAFTGATRPGSYWNRGSAITTSEYYRFFIYVSGSTIANTDQVCVAAGGTQTDGTNTSAHSWAVRIFNSGGQLVMYGSNDASANTGTVNISSSTWYRVELAWVYNTASTGITFKVYNMAGTQVGSTGTVASGAIACQYLHFGCFRTDNSNAMNVYIDGIGVSSSGYLGI